MSTGDLRVEEGDAVDAPALENRYLFHRTLRKSSAFPYPNAAIGLYSRRIAHAVMRGVWGSR